MEEGRVGGVEEREAVQPVVTAVGQDQGGPFAELGLACQEGGLQGVEGGEGVGSWEGEGWGGGWGWEGARGGGGWGWAGGGWDLGRCGWG